MAPLSFEPPVGKVSSVELPVGQLSSVVEAVAAVEADVLDGHFRLTLITIVGVVVELGSPEKLKILIEKHICTYFRTN